jgi:NAD-dependent SIR2 family protein deacetylase
MAYDKSVFILGAGASVPAGAPVLNDFLKKARELLDNPNSELDNADREAFKHVFEWRGRMYPALRFLKLDLENMENLFCLVDMSYQLGFEKKKNIINDLIRLVGRTLDLTIKFKEIYKIDNLTDKTYLDFINLLENWKQEKLDFINLLENRNQLKSDAKKIGLDSIITLNYDIVCDQVFYIREIPFTYDYPPVDPDDSAYKLLKLHGSINWGVCLKCKHIKTVPYFPSSPYTNLYNLDIAKRIYDIPCEKCKKPLIPFIVPPTWNKIAYSKGLKSIWKSASKEIEQTTRIIIIGYSLPETDSYFKYLLAISLLKNESLQEIILINPAQGQEGEALENRYRDFIAPFFDTRNFKFWRVGFQKGIDLLKKRNYDSINFKEELQLYEEEAKNQ